MAISRTTDHRRPHVGIKRIVHLTAGTGTAAAAAAAAGGGGAVAAASVQTSCFL